MGRRRLGHRWSGNGLVRRDDHMDSRHPRLRLTTQAQANSAIRPLLLNTQNRGLLPLLPPQKMRVPSMLLNKEQSSMRAVLCFCRVIYSIALLAMNVRHWVPRALTASLRPMFDSSSTGIANRVQKLYSVCISPSKQTSWPPLS